MTTRISVVLCAHNPRERHFRSTLAGLQQQDLPLDQWELLVVDNASRPELASQYSVAWHPAGRIIIEPELGLARARRRGYLEARGELIVHSDDDNLLAPDYLRRSWEIYQQHPEIGAFGGQWTPQFDRPPQSALEYSFGGERKLERDVWSNILDDNRTMPFGAGMCIRRKVIDAYLAEIEKDPRRLILGRTGDRFITGEDIDLNYVAVRQGFGTGLFQALHLTHFIPPERMTARHIIRYRAGNAYSMVILQYLHFGEIRVPHYSATGALLFWLRVWLRLPPHERRKEIAVHRARQQAIADLRRWGWLDDERSSAPTA
jgi:glycosyltransferase involved in cell wall biosynthesis